MTLSRPRGRLPRADRGRIPAVLNRGAAALSLVAMLLAGCTAARTPPPERVHTSGLDDAAKHGPGEVVQAMQADRLYVMAGDDVLHAGLGTVTDRGLKPVKGPQSPPLLSNLASNGRAVIMGAAGVVRRSYTDGVYRLSDSGLTSLAGPNLGLYGPTIDGRGDVTAIHTDGGFSVLRPGGRTWVLDPRLRHVRLSSVSFGRDRTGYAITQPNTPSARLVALPADGGVRILGSAYCGALPLRAPSGPELALTAPVQGQRCGVDRARVIDIRTGAAHVLPAGWHPLVWSRDGTTLLVSDHHRLLAWDVRSSRVTATADVGVHIWMAAPVWP